MKALLLLLAILASGPPENSQQPVLSVDELVRRKLPGGDNWETEKHHDAAKHQLKALAKLLSNPDARSRLELSKLAVTDCRASNLRPVATGTRFQHAGLSVVRTRIASDLKAEVKPLAEALSALMQPYGSVAGQRFAFKTLRVSENNAGRFDMTVFYHCYGPADDGVVEQHAVWHIDWRIADDPEHPLMESIRVSEFSEATNASPIFADCTHAVLSGADAWAEQLRRGIDYWHTREDTLGGVTFLGHQGIAIGDANGDGLQDLYVAQSSGMPNLLLLQRPDGTVLNGAAEAGVDFLDDTRGVLFVDIDNDGDQDLCAAIGPTVVVLSNNGRGGFVAIAAIRAPDQSDFYSLTAADYDVDGDLDLFATRYVVGRYGVTIPLPWHDANNGPSNHLYRNDGSGKFVDVTREVGLDSDNRRFSLSAGWADYDDDGDPDLYIANDFGRNNLFRNDGGKFTSVAAESGTEDQAAGMGVSWADFDRDGKLDLHVGNMFSSAGNRIAYQSRFMAEHGDKTRAEFQKHAQGNTLFRNRGDGTFEDVSDRAGIRMGRWSWGARFVDFNGDGNPDILSPNGFITNTDKDDL